MDATLRAALLAFAGYSLLNLGQAGQKIGLGMTGERAFGGWLIWGGATASTSAAFFVVFGAISMGAVSVVGAMAGTGLVSLAVFSRFVMGERLETRHVLALVSIVVGAALIALFDVPDRGEARVDLLWWLLAGGTVLFVVPWAIVRRGALAGAIVGGLSGFLGAYSQLFQELATTELPWSDGLGAVGRVVLTDPITVVWAGLSIGSMVVLQFSYKHGDATQIIPVFTGIFILVPVVGGVVVFEEALGWLQWAGVALILAGALVLGRKRAVSESDEVDQSEEG